MSEKIDYIYLAPRRLELSSVFRQGSQPARGDALPRHRWVGAHDSR